MRSVILRLLAALTVVFASAALTGCRQSEGPSLKLVPATAEWAVVIDLQLIEQNSDSCGTDNSTSILTALVPEDFSHIFQTLTPCVDKKQMVIFKPAETRGPIAVAAVSDQSAFVETLQADNWEKIRISDETAYVPEGAREFSPCIFIDGNNIFLLSTRSDLRNLQTCIKSADNADFLSKIPEPLLPDDSELAFYCPLPDNDKELLCVRSKSDIPHNSATVRAIITEAGSDKSGQPVEMSFLKPLGTDSIPGLSNLPGGYSLRAVFGIPAGINWNALADMASGSLDTQSHGLLQSLLPYMSQLDGPLAIGIGPFGYSNMTADRLEAQTIYISATFQPGKALDIVEEINGNLREKGITPRPGANGIYAFNLNNTKYRYTVRGNEFLFAQNREIEENWNSELNIDPQMTGAVSLMLPPLRDIIPDAPSDNSISAALKMTATEIEMTVTCTAGSPLTAFATYFETLGAALRNLEQSDEDYFDTY